MRLNWEPWLYGLFAGAIGGASTSALSWVSMGAAHAVGVDVPLLNFKALGIILLSGAAPSLFAYLKQSPLPPIETKTTTVTVQETTVLTTPPPPTEKK